MTSLLDTINSPLQLRQLDRKQLNQLAQELREFLVSSVAKTGGHLASNLGVVELTIALLCFGSLLTVISSLLAVRKYLKV